MKRIKKKKISESLLEIVKLKSNNKVIDHFKTHYWDGAEFIGKYEFIKLTPINIKNIPNDDDVISFNEIFNAKYKRDIDKYWVDMFNDDIIIERF